MKVLKQVFNFYINSSIHVALSVLSLAAITFMEFDVLIDKSFLYFVFFATITGYNFVKFFGLAKFHHRSLANWLRAIQYFSFVSFLLMCYYAFKLSFSALICVGGLAAITFFYAIPYFPKRFIIKINNLRTVEGLKVYVIALVWMVVTAILPLINADYYFNTDVFLVSFQRFVFVIVLMLPFEIRDLRYDSLKLATIPQKLGVQQTKVMGVVLLLFFVLLEFFKKEFDVTNLELVALIALLTGWFLIRSKRDQNKYYSSFWVEGVPIFWLLLVFVFR
jgi:hypothetical protein